MVTIDVQEQSDIAGGLPSFSIPDAEGVQFLNDGNTQMVFWNTDGSANEYFVAAGRPFQGTGFFIPYPQAGTNEEGSNSIPGGGAYTNSPFFLPERFNDGPGRLQVSFASIVNIQVAAVRVQTAAHGGII